MKLLNGETHKADGGNSFSVIHSADADLDLDLVLPVQTRASARAI